MTAPDSSIVNNPHFKNLERAPYELGHLLEKMPPDFASYNLASQEARLFADAAAQHADNARGTLLSGLESLGKIMFIASHAENSEIDRQTLSDFACLVQYIAVEVEYLCEVADDYPFCLREQEKLMSKKGGK